MTKLPKTIAYKSYNIPTGTTANNKTQRRLIIADFYKKWIGENGEKKIKNDELKQFIHVNKLSRKKTMNEACNTFRSTLTILELSYVLKHAVKVGRSDPKENKNQKIFHDMFIMECVVPKLRPYVTTAKLTVGVIRHGNRKLQYCLTAK